VNNLDFAAESTEAKVKDFLYQVIDPEIALNIVDMGLVYGISVQDELAHLQLTLTTPMCPLTEAIEQQVRQVLLGLVKGVEIEWVWEPVWNFSMITPEGIDQLRSIGFPV
jgi:metal-sulfur cluster biosynthetic enzyme